MRWPASSAWNMPSVTRLRASIMPRKSSREYSCTWKPRCWSASRSPCADRSTRASRTGVAETPYCSAISFTVNSWPGWSRPASTSSRSASAICCRSVLRVTAPLLLLPGIVGRLPRAGADGVLVHMYTSTPPYAFERRECLLRVLARQGERAVQRGQPLLQPRLADVARRPHMCPVHVDEGPDALLLRGRPERGHGGVRRTRRVVRHQRLAGLPVLHQLQRPEHADAAHLADARVPLGELPERGLQDGRTEAPGVVDDALLGHDVDRRDSGGAGEGVPGVGEAAGVRPLAEGVGDLLRDGDPAERHVSAVDALGEGHQVGGDVEQVGGEPLAGASESGHDLVQDEDDAVLVADLADTGEVAGRRDHDPRGA